jgi:dethiobiotin synthetase
MVLGINTDIGKTYFVENFCKKNSNFFAIKPIISGFNNPIDSDSGKILKALNLEINNKNLDLISPWRFKPALSPNFIKNIEFDEILNFCIKNIEICRKNNKKLLIEGLGGVMSPINNKNNYLDVAKKLNSPIILITANFLGSISQTLCAVSAIKDYGLNIDKIIVNSNHKKPVSDKKFINCLEKFINHEIIIIKKILK